MNVYKNKVEKYYEEENIDLIYGDSLKVLSSIKTGTIDMIFADPPYFLSNNGITCKSGKMVSVNKGDWDKNKGIKEKHSFNKEWIRKCKRVLKDNGSIWISGTMHNIYSIGMALEEEGFIIINNITWRKLNPPPNISCRAFTHSTETILWAKKNCKKNKYKFNYQLMKEVNEGKQMKDVWETSTVGKREKQFGNHPTQKPLKLLERIVLASTEETEIILDPFSGSGTTGVIAKKLKRGYIGIDNNKDYLNISIYRLKER